MRLNYLHKSRYFDTHNVSRKNRHQKILGHVAQVTFSQRFFSLPSLSDDAYTQVHDPRKLDAQVLWCKKLSLGGRPGAHRIGERGLRQFWADRVGQREDVQRWGKPSRSLLLCKLFMRDVERPLESFFFSPRRINCVGIVKFSGLRWFFLPLFFTGRYTHHLHFHAQLAGVAVAVTVHRPRVGGWR